ncbi:hypothetical protein Vretifemale_12787, partial [Volvox reticuliferus]
MLLSRTFSPLHGFGSATVAATAVPVAIAATAALAVTTTERSMPSAAASSGAATPTGLCGSSGSGRSAAAKAALDQLTARFASRDPLDDGAVTQPLTVNDPAGGVNHNHGAGWLGGLWPSGSPPPAKREFQPIAAQRTTSSASSVGVAGVRGPTPAASWTGRCLHGQV